jgi:hypothetical protein
MMPLFFCTLYNRLSFALKSTRRRSMWGSSFGSLLSKTAISHWMKYLFVLRSLAISCWVKILGFLIKRCDFDIRCAFLLRLCLLPIKHTAIRDIPNTFTNTHVGILTSTRIYQNIVSSAHWSIYSRTSESPTELFMYVCLHWFRVLRPILYRITS